MEIRANSASGERRRNLRLIAASIIYVELGSGNGGIIVNLGVDGLAFQAACKLTVEEESTLDLRLHGAGLNTELKGKIAWLGATQKEAGICFKSISAKAKEDIAGWIARRGQVCQPATQAEQSRLKPNPANPDSSASEDKVSNSLLPAPAGGGTTPLNADPRHNEARLRAYLASAASIDRPRNHNAVWATSPQRPQIERSWFYRQRIEPGAERLSGSPTYTVSSVVPAEPSKPQVRPLPAQNSQQPRSNGEIGRVVRESPASPREITAAQRWLRHVLISGWRRANRHQKLMLANAAAGGACIVLLILILSIHVASPVNHPPAHRFVQQAGAAPKVSSLAHSSSQAEVTPTVSRVSNSSQPQSDLPSTHSAMVRTHPALKSTLKDLSDFFFGSGLNKKTSVDAYQDHVQVWISKGSGYYYCADSRYYETLQPGAFMTQGGALQSGYQPKLGQPCE